MLIYGHRLFRRFSERLSSQRSGMHQFRAGWDFWNITLNHVRIRSAFRMARVITFGAVHWVDGVVPLPFADSVFPIHISVVPNFDLSIPNFPRLWHVATMKTAAEL